MKSYLICKKKKNILRYLSCMYFIYLLCLKKKKKTHTLKPFINTQRIYFSCFKFFKLSTYS